MSRIDVQEATLQMRKEVTVKIGDTLMFLPQIEALAGEDREWFQKYAGMKSEILGFGEDGLTGTLRSMFHGRGGKSLKKVVGRFFVRFENGEEPSHSISKIHFVMI